MKPACRRCVRCFWNFPDDERAAAIDDEFLFGSDLLVAPVLWEGADGRDVYLPAGDWFDYWTGQRYTGNSTISRSGDAGFHSDLSCVAAVSFSASRWCNAPVKCLAIR